jgi:hypothetical protein
MRQSSLVTGRSAARTGVVSRPAFARPAPTPVRSTCSSSPARYYVGHRQRRRQVYVVTRAELEPLGHCGYRSDAAFDWGKVTDGALELAFSILADSTRSEPTDLVCEAFCREVVAALDQAGFVLHHGDVALWLLTRFGDPGPDGPERGQPPGLARRAVDRIRAWLRRG